MANTRKIKTPVTINIRMDAREQLAIQQMQATYTASQNDIVRAAILMLDNASEETAKLFLKEVK